MEVNVDHFMKIGKSHLVCDDYVLSGLTPIPYVILSDGCSSSKHTDVGARILCHSAKRVIEQHYDDKIVMGGMNVLSHVIVYKAYDTLRVLNLPINALDATLVIAYCYNGAVHVVMFGDGSIITRSPYNNDQISIHTVEYTNNAPYYLSYLLDRDRNEAFKNMGGEKVFESICLGNDSDYGRSTDITRTTMYQKNHYEFYNGLYDLVVVSSDGIDSFVNIDGSEIIEGRHIARELFNFKNMNGQFLHRRANKMIKNFEKGGVQHFDDVSFGGIYIGEG